MKRLAMICIAVCLAAFIASSAIVWWHHWHDRVLTMGELSNFTIDQTTGTATDVP